MCTVQHKHCPRSTLILGHPVLPISLYRCFSKFTVQRTTFWGESCAVFVKTRISGLYQMPTEVTGMGNSIWTFKWSRQEILIHWVPGTTALFFKGGWLWRPRVYFPPISLSCSELWHCRLTFFFPLFIHIEPFFFLSGYCFPLIKWLQSWLRNVINPLSITLIDLTTWLDPERGRFPQWSLIKKGKAKQRPM